MPRMFLTPARVRSIIAGTYNEMDLAQALRRHRIRFHWTTAPGCLAARVPVRSGTVLIYRTGARSAPFAVRASAPDRYPFPLPRFTWDD